VRRRLSGLLALFVFLAGPLGLLAVEHGAFHRPQCGSDTPSGEHGAPCPICHFLTTTSLHAPAPVVRLPAPLTLGDVVVLPESLPSDRPASTALRTRAPPFLLA
jgi:hypothetical protein